ncbi:Uncharacterized protein FKW44_015724, partial [Caligus rogercresseyi]
MKNLYVDPTRTLGDLCTLYADDLTIFKSGTTCRVLYSIKSSLDTINAFKKCSGLSINVTKTQIVTNCGNELKPFLNDFAFVDSASILGIDVASYSSITDKINMTRILEILQKS